MDINAEMFAKCDIVDGECFIFNSKHRLHVSYNTLRKFVRMNRRTRYTDVVSLAWGIPKGYDFKNGDNTDLTGDNKELKYVDDDVEHTDDQPIFELSEKEASRYGAVTFARKRYVMDSDVLLDIFNTKSTKFTDVPGFDYPFVQGTPLHKLVAQLNGFEHDLSNMKLVFSGDKADLRSKNMKVLHASEGAVAAKHSNVKYLSHFVKTRKGGTTIIVNPAWGNSSRVYIQLRNNVFWSVTPNLYKKICAHNTHTGSYYTTNVVNGKTYVVTRPTNKAVTTLFGVLPELECLPKVIHDNEINLSSESDEMDVELITQQSRREPSNTLRDAIQIEEGLWEMPCRKGKTTLLDKESVERLRAFEEENGPQRFYVNGGGYATANPSKLYLHQIITGFYGNGHGIKKGSVDHIDRDKLNNRFTNLRIATFEEQHTNRKGVLPGTKCARQKGACDLPEGITQDMLPKYVVYSNSCYNKEKQSYRERFYIDRHPKLDGRYICSTSSKTVSIEDKLKEIIEKLRALESGTYDEIYCRERKYPVGIFVKEYRKTPHFVLDYRGKTTRYNLRMKICASRSEEEEYERFREKVAAKYPAFLSEDAAIP
jgi:hypothetical protein